MNLDELKAEYKALRKKISQLCDDEDNIANELGKCYDRCTEIENILGISFLEGR